MSNVVMNFIYQRRGHLLSDFQQQWLSPVHLKEYDVAIHAKGAALENCWGFIDGTVRAVTRPGKKSVFAV